MTKMESFPPPLPVRLAVLATGAAANRWLNLLSGFCKRVTMRVLGGLEPVELDAVSASELVVTVVEVG